jgi:hypothetical protein
MASPDMQGLPEVELYLRLDSQDAWVVFPPLPPSLLAGLNTPVGTGNGDGDGDIVLGASRADGVLAGRFKRAGLEVLNPAFEIVTVHNEVKLTDGPESHAEVVTNEGVPRFFRNAYRVAAAIGEAIPVFLSFL